MASGPPTSDERLQVVATFYPLGYFAERIGGEDARVRTLIPSSVELHAIDLSPGDIAAVREADLFIYNGAGLEPWVEEDILPALDVGQTLVVEATRLAEDYLIPPHEGDDHDLGGEFDPHTWIDPFIARLEAQAILEAFQGVDPANSESYQARAEALLTSLQTIHASYDSELSNRSLGAIIVAHDAFSYLGRRYGFEVIGIIGLTAEEHPSPIHLLEIVDRMQEEGIYTLYVTPVYSDAYVQALKSTLERDAGVVVAILSLYLLTGPDDGRNYLEQMEANLESLKVGLDA